MNLFEAIKRGSYNDIENCIARKEPVNMMDNAGLTPLHWAAIKNNPFAIELLVKHGAQLDCPGTRLNITPLHLAAIRNARSAAEKLIELGANPNVENVSGHSPLDIIFSLNEKADFIGAFAEFMPEAGLADKMDYGFDVLLVLLENSAIVKDTKRFNDVVTNALMHDRADIVVAAQNAGFHYKKLQEGMTLYIGGFELPYEIAVGYDYALMLAMSNVSLECLKYLHAQDPNCFISNADTISDAVARSPLIWVAQQFPENAVFGAVQAFIALQDEQKLTLQDLDKHLPRALRDYQEDISYGFDRKNERYYISKVLVGLCAIYFDENGSPKNMQARIENLKYMLEYLDTEHGIKISEADKADDYVAKFIVECPLSIIQCFIDAGVRFRGMDFQRALRVQTPDVIKAMIPYSDVCWKNKENKDALQVLMNSSNDLLLDAMPELIHMIEIEQARALVTQLENTHLTEKTSDQETDSVLYSAPSFMPGFDAQSSRAPEVEHVVLSQEKRVQQSSMRPCT